MRGFTEAVRVLGHAGGDVLIMTDGQVSGTEQILADARATSTRLHCLGIGSASQDRFLALLARETGGMSRFVTPRERVDLSAVDLFASIGRTVASGLEVSRNVQPQPPSAVFMGTPVVLLGEGTDPIELKWDGGQLSLPVASVDREVGGTLRLLQGARLITDQDARYPASEAFGPLEVRKQSHVAARLRDLSRKYGLASREMSLVAVVKRAGDRPGELPETKLVPVGMPQDTPWAAYFSKPGGGTSAVSATAMRMFAAAPPAFSRARFDTSDAPPAAAPASSEDALLEIAARMESDGGMPGNDDEARASASIAALFAFLSKGHTRHSGAFRSHVSRLIAYLRSLQGLDPGRLRLLAAALALADQHSVPAVDWFRLAGNRNIRWNDIEVALSAGGALNLRLT
jgi:hypothetical protein